MTLKVELPPALKTFAQDCVSDGRYPNVSEVLISGLRLLQDQEARKAAFMAMLKEAEAEADRDGCFTVEEVMAEIDELIDGIDAENKAKTAVG
ncbi:type II toxin-antitoxin system ParD family antitoxin [Caulobacter sp. ErkDOM-YI]|uniref:type II toxin-antitoxin system ParD family antitoxin n=1 Tax=unclassified Caulobacter TaxID=2648921 RepID=UPI003AF50417